jgi:hypothetical protein
MAKEIQISTDGGTTYLTLPGSSGELSRSQAGLDDTIFGSAFTSNQPGITSWTISANAYYKGYAGYVAKIQKSGTSTSASSESFSQVGSTQTYEIDDAAKRVWDPAKSVDIKDSGSSVSESDIESLDYLYGQVTFVSSYTVSGSITADLNYLPMSQFGQAQTFTLSQTADTEDVTTLSDSNSNGGWAVMDYSQLSAELSTEGFWSTTNSIHDLITSRDLLVMELNPDGAGDSFVRGFFKVSEDTQNADTGASEAESVTYSLFVPENPNGINPVTPLSWKHGSSTTLSPVIQNLLSAWLNKNKVKMKYFPEDPSSNGYQGDAVLSDISLEGGIGNMNEFTVNMSGSGALSKLP